MSPVGECNDGRKPSRWEIAIGRLIQRSAHRRESPDAAQAACGGARDPDQGHRDLRDHLRPPGARRGPGGAVSGEAEAVAGVTGFRAVLTVSFAGSSEQNLPAGTRSDGQLSIDTVHFVGDQVISASRLEGALPARAIVESGPRARREAAAHPHRPRSEHRPAGMDIPGFRLHSLKGRMLGHHAVSVSGNWRVTFRFEDGNAVDVDYLDYH